MRVKAKATKVREAITKMDTVGILSVPEVCYVVFGNCAFPVQKAAVVRSWLKRHSEGIHLHSGYQHSELYHNLYNRNPPRAIAVSKGTVMQMLRDEQWLTVNQD